MRQLYAKIKKSSKYYIQTRWAIDAGYGLPFEVEIEDTFDLYCVHGAGQRYRVKDLNFFVIVNGVEIKLGGK